MEPATVRTTSLSASPATPDAPVSVLVYARTSTRHAGAIDDQVRNCIEYAATHLRFDRLDVVRERRTGAGDALVGLLEPGKYSYLIVEDISRLSRRFRVRLEDNLSRRAPLGHAAEQVTSKLRLKVLTVMGLGPNV